MKLPSISFQLIVFDFNVTAIHPSDNDYNSIRNTLAHYPLAIDGKDFSKLSVIFTLTAIANRSEPINVLARLPQIVAALEADLRVVSNHSCGTQLIMIYENHTADAVTYVTASHFGAGNFTGQVYYIYGKYFDHLILTNEDNGGWRIDKRHFVYMGTGQGNIAIFTGTANRSAAPSS